MLPNAQPKPRPRLLDKRDAKAAVTEIDKKQRAICLERSMGFCEVLEASGRHPWPQRGFQRCGRRATQNHHLLGGIGRRNKGRSILAEHRLDVCDRCHEEITGKVLVPCVEQSKAERAATVRYERIR